ncbi:MAG: hypothetical protein WCC17_24645 [Candidatus Nitrosopolaris sp.]
MEYRTNGGEIARHAIAIVAIGSLVLLTIIVIAIFLKYPTPPPIVAYNDILLAALVILVISLALAVILKRMGF